MIWKFLKQKVLFPKGLNWVQHWVSRIGLLPSKDALASKAHTVTYVQRNSGRRARPVSYDLSVIWNHKNNRQQSLIFVREILHGMTHVLTDLHNKYVAQYPDGTSIRTLETKTQFLRRPFQFSVKEVFRMKAEHFSFKMKVLAIWKLAKQSQKTPFCSGE